MEGIGQAAAALRRRRVDDTVLVVERKRFAVARNERLAAGEVLSVKKAVQRNVSRLRNPLDF